MGTEGVDVLEDCVKDDGVVWIGTEACMLASKFRRIGSFPKEMERVRYSPRPCCNAESPRDVLRTNGDGSPGSCCRIRLGPSDDLIGLIPRVGGARASIGAVWAS